LLAAILLKKCLPREHETTARNATLLKKKKRKEKKRGREREERKEKRKKKRKKIRHSERRVAVR